MTSLREVAGSSLRALRRNADILDNNALAAGARNLDINSLSAIPSGVLEVVVCLALGLLPRLSTVSRHLKRGDGDVGVLDLHAEPVGAGAFLVLQHDGGGDAAGHNVPADGDHALLGLGELGEGVRVEIEVVGAAAGALVDDHGGDLVARGAGDADAGSAVAGVGPVGVRQGGAEEGRWDSVSSEPIGRLAVVHEPMDVRLTSTFRHQCCRRRR